MEEGEEAREIQKIHSRKEWKVTQTNDCVENKKKEVKRSQLKLQRQAKVKQGENQKIILKKQNIPRIAKWTCGKQRFSEDVVLFFHSSVICAQVSCLAQS